MKNQNKLVIALLSLALIFSVSVMLFNNDTDVSFASGTDYNLIDAIEPDIGDGLSESTAYEISNVNNIKWLDECTLSNNTENIFYKLINDIDLTNLKNFRPIGQSPSLNVAFKGNFNGNEKIISNLTYNNLKINIADGFFGTIENASIKNLTLKNFKFSDITRSTSTVGMFAGEMIGNSVLSYCTAESDVNLSDSVFPYKGVIDAKSRVGGMVGYMSGGKIEFCRSNVQLKGSSVVGGLVGEVGLVNGVTNSNIQISNSYSIGNIVRIAGDVAENFGGLVGKITNNNSMVYRVAFLKCYFSGLMDVNIDSMGILLGVNKAGVATFNSCYYNKNALASATHRVAYPNESGDANTIGRQSNEMQNTNALKSLDFSTVWVINNKIASDSVATFGKYPDFAKYYDTVLISAKFNGAVNSEYCNLNSDRLFIKGDDLEIVFNPMENARVGSVIINGDDYTSLFYQENANGKYVKDGFNYVPYNKNIHGLSATKYSAVNYGVIENVQNALNITYSFIEKTVKLNINNQIANSLRLVNINGEQVSTGVIDENILYNSVLEFQVTIPYGYKIKSILATDNENNALAIKLDNNNRFTIKMNKDVIVDINWEKINIPLTFVKSMDITAYRDVNYGMIQLLVNNAEPTLDANNKVNIYAGDRITFKAIENEGFKFIGWQITGEDDLILNEEYTIASVFEDFSELKIIARFTKVWTVDVDFSNDLNKGHLFINGVEIEAGTSEIEVYHGKVNDFNFVINAGESNYEGTLMLGKSKVSKTFNVTNDGVKINASIALKTAKLTLSNVQNTQVSYKSNIDDEYIKANRNTAGHIIIDRPIGSKIYLLVTPNTGEFSKWTLNNADGLVFDMVSNKIIRNDNGIIVKNEFEYICSANRSLYFNAEAVHSVTISLKDKTNPTATAYIDTVNGVSLYNEFNSDGTPLKPYYTANVKINDVVTMKIILNDGYLLETKNLNTSGIEQIGNVVKYTVSNINAYGNSILIETYKKTYKINARSEDDSFGKISVSEGPYYKGSVVNLKSTISNGYRFIGYVINNKLITDISPINYSYTITGEFDTINILSRYEKVDTDTTTYKITLNKANITGYNYQISGSGVYDAGSAVSVLFKSDELDFIGWFDGDLCLSTSERYNFICSKNTTLTPHAKVKSFTIVKSDNNNKLISILPERENGIYNINEEITLNYSAIGLQQNDFEYWTNNGFKMVGNSLSPKFSLKVTENLVIDALTTPKKAPSDGSSTVFYKINYAPNNNAMGIARSTNGSQFIEGGITQLKAVPHKGYEFLYWEENGVRVTYNDTYIVNNIASDMNFIAVFQPIKCEIIYSSNNAIGGTYEGVTKAVSGSDHQIVVDAKMGYRIDSVLVNGVPMDISNDKTAIINLSDIDNTQNITINYKKTGLSSSEMIILGGAGGLLFILVIGFIIILSVKPNKRKLERLVSAKQSAMAIIEASNAKIDDEANDDDE